MSDATPTPARPVRFLADEDLRFSITTGVRRRSAQLTIRTVQEWGLTQQSDEAVLKFAFQEGLVVVSHDVNTLRREAEARLDRGLHISGLLLVPQRAPNRTIIESIVFIFENTTADEWTDVIAFLPL